METPNDDRVGRAIAAIHAQLARSWRINDLAALALLSPSRFAHLFRRAVGVPPGRYLQQLRMDRARQLLENTPAPVAEVMRTVGYIDPSHFARDFRRRFGAGPREWRRDHRLRSRCLPRALDVDSPRPASRRPLEDR